MIYVVARAQVKAEKLDEYLQIVNALVPTVLAEDGCLRYEPCVDWSEDGTRAPFVTMLETWASKKHLDDHLASAHLQAFREQAAEYRVGSSELHILTGALL